MKTPPISSNNSSGGSNNSAALNDLSQIIADLKAIRSNPNNNAAQQKLEQAIQNLNKDMKNLSPSLQLAIKNFLDLGVQGLDPTNPLNMDDTLSTAQTIYALANQNPHTSISMIDFQNLTYLKQLQNYVQDYQSSGQIVWSDLSSSIGNLASEFMPNQLNANAESIYNNFANPLDIADWSDSTPQITSQQENQMIQGASQAFNAQLTSFR